jgi:deoxycytidylate deaminase
MNPRFFEIAKKVSKKSNHEFPMGAIIIRKGKVIGRGVNKDKTHTKSNHTYRNVHAELSAVLNTRLSDLEDCEVYVYRETKDEVMAMAKPCVFCQEMLKSLGIKKVHYTILDGIDEDWY